MFCILLGEVHIILIKTKSCWICSIAKAYSQSNGKKTTITTFLLPLHITILINNDFIQDDFCQHFLQFIAQPYRYIESLTFIVEGGHRVVDTACYPMVLVEMQYLNKYLLAWLLQELFSGDP